MSQIHVRFNFVLLAKAGSFFQNLIQPGVPKALHIAPNGHCSYFTHKLPAYIGSRDFTFELIAVTKQPIRHWSLSKGHFHWFLKS